MSWTRSGPPKRVVQAYRRFGEAESDDNPYSTVEKAARAIEYGTSRRTVRTQGGSTLPREAERYKPYLVSRDIGILGGRHEFIRVVDTQTGKPVWGCDYGPSGSKLKPTLGELNGTDAPTARDDDRAWARRGDARSPYKATVIEIPASANAVIASCRAVDQKLKAGKIPYHFYPNPRGVEANSNTAARVAANNAVKSENPRAATLPAPKNPSFTPGWDNSLTGYTGPP